MLRLIASYVNVNHANLPDTGFSTSYTDEQFLLDLQCQQTLPNPICLKFVNLLEKTYEAFSIPA